MNRPLSDTSHDEFIVEMLALQYIQGKTTNSAADYVAMYRKAKDEIKSAYSEPFNLEGMI